MLNGDDVGASRVAPRLLQAVREDVALALLVVGAATSAMAVRASSRPPAQQGVSVVAHPFAVQPGALRWAFWGGVASMCAAVWVAVDEPRRSGAGRVILCAAFVPLVVTFGLGGGDGLELAFNVINALF
ncbi:hypothetical protein ACP70R_031175 [Stipagrostis hirtigluma subsp. patula]